MGVVDRRQRIEEAVLGGGPGLIANPIVEFRVAWKHESGYHYSDWKKARHLSDLYEGCCRIISRAG